MAGLPKVLEQIRLALGVSERQRELTTLDRAAQRVEALRQTVAESQHAEQLLRSQHGADLVTSSIDTVWETIMKVLCSDVDPSAPVKFGCRRPMPNVMHVSTVRGMYLALHPTNMYVNSAADARLEVKIFRREWDRFGEPVSEVMSRHDAKFQPTFGPGDRVVWLNQDRTAKYSAEELAGYLIELFVKYV